MQKTLTLIAAMGSKRAIGLDGTMPWHLPAELQHFKQATMGKTIVMGRKTWQSIGRPLPDRQNIVISRNPALVLDGAGLATSLTAAIEMATADEIMVIGGGQLYTLALPLARRMLLTLIDIDPPADTWFPAWDDDEWEQAEVGQVQADESGDLAYRIIEYTRKN